jgi:hypothetical protein
MSDIARYYDRDANPDGRVFHGVPLADVSQSHWDTLPQWLRDSVDESGLYRKTPPGKGKAKAEAAPAASEAPAAKKEG